jgi:arsenate reductase
VFTPADLNPLVVEVMREEGIAISYRKANQVLDLVKAGKIYNYVKSTSGIRYNNNSC